MNWSKEVNHVCHGRASRPPPSTANLTPRVALMELWQVLPAERRQRILVVLSRLVAQQLANSQSQPLANLQLMASPPPRKEVEHEHD